MSLPRTVRVPRGTRLTCKSWWNEAITAANKHGIKIPMRKD